MRVAPGGFTVVGGETARYSRKDGERGETRQRERERGRKQEVGDINRRVEREKDATVMEWQNERRWKREEDRKKQRRG